MSNSKIVVYAKNAKYTCNLFFFPLLKALPWFVVTTIFYPCKIELINSFTDFFFHSDWLSTICYLSRITVALSSSSQLLLWRHCRSQIAFRGGHHMTFHPTAGRFVRFVHLPITHINRINYFRKYESWILLFVYYVWCT